MKRTNELVGERLPDTTGLIAELNDEIGELCDDAKADGLPEPWPVHLLGRCRDELVRLQRAENTVKAEALMQAAEDIELGDWTHHGNYSDRWNAEAEASTWLERRAAAKPTRRG